VHCTYIQLIKRKIPTNEFVGILCCKWNIHWLEFDPSYILHIPPDNEKLKYTNQGISSIRWNFTHIFITTSDFMESLVPVNAIIQLAERLDSRDDSRAKLIQFIWVCGVNCATWIAGVPFGQLVLKCLRLAAVHNFN